MKSNHSRSFISALFSILLLISCGAGGGGMLAGGGIGGTGIISSGVIMAFGSIVVNGTEFDTTNAAIIVNGEEIGVGDEFVQGSLDIGRVVTVEGTGSLDDSSAVAVRVIYNDNVRGPVESVQDIDATTKEIVVLGQIVIVNVITKFKETNFTDIAVDDVVAASGYVDDNGLIRATFLEKIGDITSVLDFEVTGLVENLDPDLKTFMINGLEIDYSPIANLLPEGIPADGLFVEVEGRLAAGGEMTAMTIEPADDLGGEDGNEVEIMGFVTEIISENGIIKFKIGNQEVHVNSDPAIVEYVDGDPADILPGQKLEAEGSLAEGILIAHEIEFWQPDQIEVEGIVTEVNSGVDPIEFTISNQDGDLLVKTDNETVYEGVVREEIEVGMPIEVKGVPLNFDISVLSADKVSFELE